MFLVMPDFQRRTFFREHIVFGTKIKKLKKQKKSK